MAVRGSSSGQSANHGLADLDWGESEFITEPVVGWRCWYLALDRDGPRLLSVAGIQQPWTPRAPYVAWCGKLGFLESHQCPGEACTCGIYGARTTRDLAKTGWTMVAPVIGTVSMWGRVIEHERGFRARFAYPARLRLVCPRCLGSRAGSGVPTNAFVGDGVSAGGLSVRCTAHASEMTSISLCDAEVLQAELLDTYAVDLLPQEAIAPFLRRSRPKVIRRRTRKNKTPWSETPTGIVVLGLLSLVEMLFLIWLGLSLLAWLARG